MFKDIRLLGTNNKQTFIEKFLRQCKIEEKIDAYYVSIKIMSRSMLKFYKGNREEISREDLILNSMWSSLIKDWNMFRQANESWFSSHVGYSVNVFYLPVRKPMLTEYINGVRYIVASVTETSGTRTPVSASDFDMTKEFGITFQKDVVKYRDADYKEVARKIKENPDDAASIISDEIIDWTGSDIFADSFPEGFVLRYNSKQIYQMTFSESSARNVRAEKSQYEYLLTDFIRWWEQNSKVAGLVYGDYIKSVCDVFNFYIENEKETSKIKDNIETESLEAPCFGERFPMCYKYVPSEKTVELCMEDPLYENIFKILLVNLKRKKKIEHCVLMDKRSVEKWNDIAGFFINSCR